MCIKEKKEEESLVTYRTIQKKGRKRIFHELKKKQEKNSN